METAEFTARRATLDDLPALRPMWEQERLPVNDLDRRVTEFQVAVSADGDIKGAIAMKISEGYGLIHSETFPDFGLADELRRLLWERIQKLAKSHGLVRVWMRENLSFWRTLGFDEPDEEALEKLPAEFGTADETFFTLKLRNDPFAEMSAAQEEMIFKQGLRADTDKMIKQAKMLKRVAIGFSVVFFVMIVRYLWYLWRYKQAVTTPQQGLRVVPWKR